MLEVRICENCNHHNDISRMDCDQCRMDISYIRPERVPMQGGEVEEPAPPNVDPSNPAPKPISEHLTTDSPQAPTDPGAAPRTVRMQQLRLIATRNACTIDIPLYGGVIGRDGDFAKDVFQEHLYVSNRHATIGFTGVDYTITDHSTNGTRLNHHRLERDREYPLRDGDLLIIANVEFRVQV